MNHRPDRRHLLVAVCLAVAGSIATAEAQTAVLATRLKAAVLAKLPQFVEWPSTALDGRSTLDICVASPDHFGRDLQALVAGESLNGRSLLVRPVDRDEELAGCQVVFLPAGSPAAGHPLLRRAQSLSILTVGDDPRFLDQGGIVGLRVIDGRVRFDIDVAAAQRAGLRVSSQLLRLALSVRGSVS